MSRASSSVVGLRMFGLAMVSVLPRGCCVGCAGEEYTELTSSYAKKGETMAEIVPC